MAKIVMFGSGKIAEMLYHYFTNDSDDEVVAFCVDAAYRQQDSFLGLPLVDFETVETVYPPETHDMFVALGYQQINDLRACKVEEAKAKGYRLTRYVSHNASNIGGVEIGENSILLDNATLQPTARVGANVFIWSGCLVGHHAAIEDNAYIAGNTAIGGGAVIGRNCFIALNATIGHGVDLGARSIVGAGARIVKSVAPSSVLIEAGTEKLRLDSEHFIKISKLEA